jgi:hypothetical protein
VLDFTHRLMLRGVAKGLADGEPPAPALRDLIELNLVEQQGDHVYVPTARGRELLANDK